MIFVIFRARPNPEPSGFGTGTASAKNKEIKDFVVIRDYHKLESMPHEIVLFNFTGQELKDFFQTKTFTPMDIFKAHQGQNKEL